MKTIHKFHVTIQLGTFCIPLRAFCTIRHLAMQNGYPCLWVEVDTKQAVHNRYFKWFATGEEIAEYSTYVGTVFLHDGDLVYHLYEVAR